MVLFTVFYCCLRELMLLLECDRRPYVGPVGFSVHYIRLLHSCSVGFGVFFNFFYL